MMDLFVAVLSSAVISSIITSIVSVFINKKNINLQYITNERKEWRDEIRQLTEEIYKSSRFNIGEKLIKLKVRINAFGIYQKRFTSDSHIWIIINDLENETNNENFFIYKSALIDYLSIMLKYDWERSKEEIKGNRTSLIRNTIIIVLCSLFTFLYCYVWKLQIDVKFYYIIISLITLCSYTPLYFYYDEISKIKYLKRFWFQYIIGNIIILGFTVYQFIQIIKINIICMDHIILIIVVVLCGMLNSLEMSFSQHKLTNEYINTIISRIDKMNDDISNLQKKEK